MADFKITYHLTIGLLEPVSPVCREWVEENVVTEGRQWHGNALAVEPTDLPTLIDSLIEAGFTMEDT